MDLQILFSIAVLVEKFTGLLSFQHVYYHLLSANLPSDCLSEMTPIGISCSTESQQGLQHSVGGTITTSRPLG